MMPCSSCSTASIDAPFEQVGKLIDQRQKQALLVGKVEVDRAFGGVRGFDDFVHAGVVIALVRENVQRGIEDAFARVFAFGHAALFYRPTGQSIFIIDQNLIVQANTNQIFIYLEGWFAAELY